jgi:hypothetical protein
MKLILHERCNHVNFCRLNAWIWNGVLPVDRSVGNAPDPICSACQYSKTNKKSHSDEQSITVSHTAPGQGVSMDLMEAGIPRRMPTTRGLPSPKRYKYVTLWVDHYSRYLYPKFHETKELSAALQSKQDFEAFANRFGIKIESIRADNGIYATKSFQSTCDEKGQHITFCAVGGHWQNGVVEWAIGVITRTAKTLLLHAMSRWSGTITEEFWPFAIKHACTFHNASIRADTGLSPHHMFTGQKPPWKLENFRVFGSPTFVLAKQLQDGDSLPKWKARSWLGVYVGPSLVHAWNVPIIYNPLTMHISPQFHLVHDDQFTSATMSPDILTDDFYLQLYNKAQWMYPEESTPCANNFYTFDSYCFEPPLSNKKRKNMKNANVLTEENISENVDSRKTPELGDQNIYTSQKQKNVATTNNSVDILPESIKYNLVQVHNCSTELNQWKQQNGINANVYCLDDPTANVSYPLLLSPDANQPPVCFLSYAHVAQSEEMNPTAATQASNKEDILTQSQMLKANDRNAFLESQIKEIDGLHKFDVMDLNPIAKLPPRARLLSSIWSYRQKQLLNGVLLKYKARLCVNGKEQSFGHDYYWETYAPVASWATIRMMLILSSLLNLKTCQVDYTQAFPQVHLDDPVFIRVPQGWFVENGRLRQHANPKHNDNTHYMQLKRKLYGCKQAA